MESCLIYRKSEAFQPKIDWVKLTDTEWIYCGAKGEVKLDTVADELDEFFITTKFYVATTRKDSFESTRESLLSSIEGLVGSKNFFIWDDDFQRVVEFSKIGVFRKGVFDVNTNNPIFKINYNKIAPGSPDKVKGKLVKYRKGDCLSLDCGNGKYLAVFISEKFNKYYDFTLIEYWKEQKPTTNDFINGKFFGKYFQSIPDESNYYIGTERLMLDCLAIDANPKIEKIGSLDLIDSVEKASYGYWKGIGEVMEHYLEDITQRIKNTENFYKYPDRTFISNRLIEMKRILK